VQSGTVAVEIQQVPNQPIQFMVLFILKKVMFVYLYLKGRSIAYGSIRRRYYSMALESIY
jgi:hypothetical protein